MEVEVYLIEDSTARIETIRGFIEDFAKENHPKDIELKMGCWLQDDEVVQGFYENTEIVLERINSLLSRLSTEKKAALFFVDLALTKEEGINQENGINCYELAEDIIKTIKGEGFPILIETLLNYNEVDNLLEEWGVKDYGKIEFVPAWDFEKVNQTLLKKDMVCILENLW